MNKEIIKRVDNAILEISEDFRKNPILFLSESDMKCRLFKLIDKNEKYSYGKYKTYTIHTEVGLRDGRQINKIDIFIGKFKKLNIGATKWKFDDRGEDIGIELKYGYGVNKSLLQSELKKDRGDLNEFDLTHRYIVCFDHNGRFTKKEIEKLLIGVKYVYVDGQNKKIYTNIK